MIIGRDDEFEFDYTRSQNKKFISFLLSMQFVFHSHIRWVTSIPIPIPISISMCPLVLS